jgi:hypothetical protein
MFNTLPVVSLYNIYVWVVHQVVSLFNKFQEEKHPNCRIILGCLFFLELRILITSLWYLQLFLYSFSSIFTRDNIYYYTVHNLLQHKHNTTIWMFFFLKFVEEGDNLVNNPNIYIVEGYNRKCVTCQESLIWLLIDVIPFIISCGTQHLCQYPVISLNREL